jgi:hypothetical protein
MTVDGCVKVSRDRRTAYPTGTSVPASVLGYPPLR